MSTGRRFNEFRICQVRWQALDGFDAFGSTDVWFVIIGVEEKVVGVIQYYCFGVNNVVQLFFVFSFIGYFVYLERNKN